MNPLIHVGIDPGTSTGYAEWNASERRLMTVETLLIHQAMRRVADLWAAGILHSVSFEDARLRKWFGSADARQARSGAGIREGVGSVKRDCSIWADYLGELAIPYRNVAPSSGATKWKADAFAKLTHWQGRTSEHARDAAMLVFGRG